MVIWLKSNKRPFVCYSRLHFRTYVMSNNSRIRKNYANQYQYHSMCLRGFCTRVCSWSSPRDDDEQCTIFHCDAKSLMLVGAETTPTLSIQTNSYPQLERYMNGAKCSWIVKLSYSNNSTRQPTHLLAFTYERFATHLANDLLYIFAGDSLASPLIAILSGGGGGEQQLPPHAKPARSLSTSSTPFLLVDTRLTPPLFFLCIDVRSGQLVGAVRWR